MSQSNQSFQQKLEHRLCPSGMAFLLSTQLKRKAALREKLYGQTDVVEGL